MAAGGWLSHPETLQTAAARYPPFFPRDSRVTDWCVKTEEVCEQKLHPAMERERPQK